MQIRKCQNEFDKLQETNEKNPGWYCQRCMFWVNCKEKLLESEDENKRSKI